MGKSPAQFLNLLKYMDCFASLAMTFVVISSHCEEHSDEAIHDFLIMQES